MKSLHERGPVPTKTPPFTLGEIRRAIPAHCFEKSLPRSMYHLLKDVLICSALATAALYIDHAAVPFAAKFVLWPLYWFFMVSVKYSSVRRIAYVRLHVATV